MSGHSKWNNIKRKKEATDAVKAKIFTKIGREMMVVIKEGGADPNNNSKLRDLIAKAKANNVPNDNIDRLIKKAAGDSDKNSYVEITYEGYGIGGVACIVECLTDNKNRTAGNIRHYFDKFGGNLGQTGCVSYLFTRKGIVVIEHDGDLQEDQVLEDAMDLGADDMTFGEESVELVCEPDALTALREGLTAKGYLVVSAEEEMIPSTYVKLEDEESRRKMTLLLEHLEDDDDVQNVWHNWDEPDEGTD